MSVIVLQAESHVQTYDTYSFWFGAHTAESILKKGLGSECPSSLKARQRMADNIKKWNCRGYVPILGIQSGYRRFKLVHAMQGLSRKIRITFVVRGIIESLCLGWTLYPVDRLITKRRFRNLNPPQQSIISV